MIYNLVPCTALCPAQDAVLSFWLPFVHHMPFLNFPDLLGGVVVGSCAFMVYIHLSMIHPYARHFQLQMQQRYDLPCFVFVIIVLELL
jgi:hypothetical protein